MMLKIIRFCSFLLIVATAVLSCRQEDDFITDGSARLEFSLDTLRFDTVFTELGSATRILKIYNRNNGPVKISRAFIRGSDGAFFRMNIDGITGNDQNDIRVHANDSIYLFAEVTVDPDLPVSASPFVIADEIVFETNGNTQTVVLEAWGQNANYFPDRFGGGGIWSPCTSSNITWDDPKPYVIYGILAIDNCTFNVPAGTRIYVHGGVTRNEMLGVYNDGIIIVLANGKIRIEGTQENPVIIQGDRLEEEFKERAGQWSGIIIDDESTGNRMVHTMVKNSILGIAVDSAADLTLKNVQIYNTSSVGLAGIHSRISAENCLVHSNGGNSLQLAYGGNYSFTYCTFASYGVDAASVSFSNGVCLDPPFCSEVLGNDLTAIFRNSILFGSRSDELTITDFGPATGAELDYRLSNCIVRVRDLIDPNKGGFTDFFDYCNPCINATPQDPLFVNENEDNYHLDTLSIAEMQAAPIPNVLLDLEGNARDPEMPDIGCYEYMPQ